MDIAALDHLEHAMVIAMVDMDADDVDPHHVDEIGPEPDGCFRVGIPGNAKTLQSFWQVQLRLVRTIGS